MDQLGQYSVSRGKCTLVVSYECYEKQSNMKNPNPVKDAHESSGCLYLQDGVWHIMQ